MNIQELIFYFFVGTTVASVLVMLFTRIVFYAALGLIVCLLSLAGIFGLLNAEFVAITQVVIYAGGVLILVLFAIMLTNRIAGKSLVIETQHTVTGSLVGVLLFIVVIASFQKTVWQQPVAVPLPANHIRHIGIELMSAYVVPFEIAGVLLLVCLIGASLMASSFKKSNHE
jgi:NADH-quinone oxidoreductase subunit J